MRETLRHDITLCFTLQAVVAKTPVKHVVVATMGDMLGVKGLS